MKIGIACRYVHANRPDRSLLYGEKLLDLLKTTMPVATAVRQGDGSADQPYTPTTIGEWFWLAQQETGVMPMYIRIGGRLIARWGSGANALQDYVTDITDHFVTPLRIATIMEMEPDYEREVRRIKGEYDEADSQAGIDTDLPIYTRKALRASAALRLSQLDDRAAVLLSRRVLRGETDCSECPELASTLASLLIAESHRSADQAIFIISLMILDLVETCTTYGAGGAKMYTWTSMLMHHVEDQQPHRIPGRGPGLKLLGKHPMAGAGTAVMGRGLFSWLGPNRTRDRAVSIMAVWLAHYMTRAFPPRPPVNFTFFIVDNRGAPADMQVLTRKDESLKGYIIQGLRDRCRDFNLMIGGTTVYYENVRGDAV